MRSLLDIKARIKDGSFAFRSEREGVHTNIQVAYTETVGEIGQKLHTARIRNDQVATELKLWLREALLEVDSWVTKLQMAVVNTVAWYPELILLIYIYLQRAQPHLLRMYCWLMPRSWSGIDRSCLIAASG